MRWRNSLRAGGGLFAVFALSFLSGCATLTPYSDQMVEASPLNPDWQDTIMVTVRTSRKDGVLHWGVNQGAGKWKLPARSLWPKQSSLGDSGRAVDIQLPEPVDGVTQVELGPFDFGGQVVTSLHFAVRFGEDEWESNGGTNFNFEVGDTLVPWAFKDTDVDEDLTLPLPDSRFDFSPVYVNGKKLALSHSDKVIIPVKNLEFGDNQITLKAADSNAVNFCKIKYFRQPELEAIELSSEFAFGATELGAGKILFHLFAPQAKFITLIGLPGGDLLMHPTGDGRWAIKLDLKPGRYTYQYEVDGARRTADPYAREVEWKNRLGQESGFAEHAFSVIHVGEHAPLIPHGLERAIPLEKLIIYESFIHDLSPHGGYRGVAKKLDEIGALGVNALEFMPVYAAPGGHQWGYNAGYHFAPEESLGTEADLKYLIGEAHTRGFAVLLDMVFNHMDAASGLAYLHGSDYDENPYFRKFDGFNWGMPDADQESPAFKAYVKDVIEFWLKEYRVDGFRYDATQWVGWKGYNDWGAGWYAWCGKQAASNSIHIAENLPCEIPMITKTEMDAEWDGHFRWRIREIFKNQEIRESGKLRDVLMPLRQGYDSGFERMVYIESHDEERYLAELLHAGFSEEEAMRRCISAWTVACTVPGVPMMFSGQEYGETAKRVVGPNPLDWRKRFSKSGRAMVKAFSEITKLRAEHPALCSEEMKIQYVNEEKGLLVYERGKSPHVAIVAMNVSSELQTAFAKLPHSGHWKWLDADNKSNLNTWYDDVKPAICALAPGGVMVLYSLSE